jgi:hypothetical protein
MHYVFNLAFPAIVALIIIITNGQAEWSLAWFEKSLENFGTNYMLLALPHWIWALISSYFDSSDGATIGGFFGAHVLLVAVGILVTTSNSPDAVNGWFLYLFGSPLAITVGAFAGRKVSRWRANNSLTHHSSGTPNRAP